jgi:putative membrane protein
VAELLARAVGVPIAQMGDGWDMGWGTGWGIAMMVAMLLFLALVIVGAVWLIRYLIRESEGSRPEHRAQASAVEVLERRFAEGEIDIDEYRERRSVLERGD